MVFRFNPRARVGRDRAIARQRFEILVFQSTRPRGARLDFDVLRAAGGDGFNPRARVGRDSAVGFKLRYG